MEILYNGIEFNEKWLVADHGKSMLETLPVPYLENPPEIKPIDIGRQLFVDDFLIEKLSISPLGKRVNHKFCYIGTL